MAWGLRRGERGEPMKELHEYGATGAYKFLARRAQHLIRWPSVDEMMHAVMPDEVRALHDLLIDNPYLQGNIKKVPRHRPTHEGTVLDIAFTVSRSLAATFHPWEEHYDYDGDKIDKHPIGFLLDEVRHPGMCEKLGAFLAPQMKQAATYHREACFARTIIHFVLANSAGPYMFSKAWPGMAKFLFATGYRGTEILKDWQDVKPLPDVDPVWRQLFERIDGWCAQARAYMMVTGTKFWDATPEKYGETLVRIVEVPQDPMTQEMMAQLAKVPLRRGRKPEQHIAGGLGWSLTGGY